ncbi:MAG TPA: hypothetical protein VIJ27_06435 [Mucilaginibacter sp.]
MKAIILKNKGMPVSNPALNLFQAILSSPQAHPAAISLPMAVKRGQKLTVPAITFAARQSAESLFY